MKIESFENIINDSQNLIDSANCLICALSDNIKEPRIFYDFDEIALQWTNENDDPFPYIEIKVLDCFQYEFEYYLENNFMKSGMFEEDEDIPEEVIKYLNDNFKKE